MPQGLVRIAIDGLHDLSVRDGFFVAIVDKATADAVKGMNPAELFELHDMVDARAFCPPFDGKGAFTHALRIAAEPHPRVIMVEASTVRQFDLFDQIAQLAQGNRSFVIVDDDGSAADVVQSLAANRFSNGDGLGVKVKFLDARFRSPSEGASHALH